MAAHYNCLAIAATKPEEELCRYDIKQAGDTQAVIMCYARRDGASWRIEALGKSTGGTVKDYTEMTHTCVRLMGELGGTTCQGSGGGGGVAAVQRITCPKKHGLEKFRTPNDHYYCKVCRREVAEGRTMHGCRQCNYDICKTCYTH